MFLFWNEKHISVDVASVEYQPMQSVKEVW